MTKPASKSVSRKTKFALETDLLQSVREMKQGLQAKVHRPNQSELARVRLRAGFSQSEFATLMGVSVRTLQDWEQGRRRPSGAAQTLIQVARRNPEVLRALGA